MPTTKRDYYEILGVEKGATKDQVKTAYRRLALKHHPDRVPAEQKKEAEERFKEISEAYAVLSDDQKRAVYDQYGHAGFDQRYTTEDIFRNADFASIFEDLGIGGGVFGDLFGMFDLFGGGSRRGRGHGARRGSDLEYELEVSLEEAFAGTHKSFVVPRLEACAECRGEGVQPGKSKQTCSQCGGSGQQRMTSGFMTMVRACGKCGGAGSIIAHPCRACNGHGRVETERKLEVRVPPGVDDGIRLRLGGEGEGGVRGGPRGDLYAQIRVRPHPIFQREGNHLWVEIPVSITQAALGAEVEVPTLNGRVKMKVPAGTQSGQVFRVRSKGMPDVQTGRPGDVLVRAVVETPSNLTHEQRRLLQEFAKTLGEDNQPLETKFFDRLKQFLKTASS